MYSISDFIKWALTHAKRATIPSGAVLPLPLAECGVEPWQYLFGSVRVKTTQATLDRYFEQHYCKQMTRAKYDALTAGWDRNGYATDCQGLLDAWLTYDCAEPTDINADMNYRMWCTDKGRVGEIERPYVVGEAMFMANSAGKMTHVGWVCGFAPDGEPLIVEARGIAYGVVVTRLDGRNWTHRGLMTKIFNYTEADTMTKKAKFELDMPMHYGEAYSKMQDALNAAGYTDDDGNPLTVDGKWGRRSQQAFDAMIADYTKPVENDNGVEPLMMYHKGDSGEYTVCVFRTAELEAHNG